MLRPAQNRFRRRRASRIPAFPRGEPSRPVRRPVERRPGGRSRREPSRDRARSLAVYGRSLVAITPSETGRDRHHVAFVHAPGSARERSERDSSTCPRAPSRRGHVPANTLSSRTDRGADQPRAVSPSLAEARQRRQCGPAEVAARYLPPRVVSTRAFRFSPSTSAEPVSGSGRETASCSPMTRLFSTGPPLAPLVCRPARLARAPNRSGMTGDLCRGHAAARQVSNQPSPPAWVE